MCKDHGLDPSGRKLEEISKEKIHVFFSEKNSSCYNSRALYFDTDPYSIDIIRSSPIASLNKIDNYISIGKNNHGSVWHDTIENGITEFFIIFIIFYLFFLWS